MTAATMAQILIGEKRQPQSWRGRENWVDFDRVPANFRFGNWHCSCAALRSTDNRLFNEIVCLLDAGIGWK